MTGSTRSWEETGLKWVRAISTPCSEGTHGAGRSGRDRDRQGCPLCPVAVGARRAQRDGTTVRSTFASKQLHHRQAGMDQTQVSSPRTSPSRLPLPRLPDHSTEVEREKFNLTDSLITHGNTSSQFAAVSSCGSAVTARLGARQASGRTPAK